MFGDTRLTYTKPPTRLTGHLAGYDPAAAPVFVWPDRLKAANEAIRGNARKRDGAAREQRTLSGWPVFISRDLTAREPEATAQALDLLKGQLEAVIRALPAAAVTELQKVPLYLSPEYPGTPPRAEYHPDAGWLAAHHRDPAMAGGIEFTNIRIFAEETRRMPNFALHELAHAYHDRVLTFDEPQILRAFLTAGAGGTYNTVDRRDAAGRVSRERAYAMTSHKEYFAESTEAYFSTNDFYPFTREELLKHDPAGAAVIEAVWSRPARKP